MKKPNIIFYFSDQQRADTCGCYGQRLPTSPNLDKLAVEGIRFDKAFSPQPVCGPCRALFQTGLYPTQTGCFRNNIALPLDVKTVADYLREAGYENAYVGKWHLASQGNLEGAPSFDYKRSAVPPERRGGYTGYWRAADVLEFTSDGYGGHVFDEHMNRIDFTGYRADCITDFALDFLKGKPADKPFFLTVSHIEPHHQNDSGHYQGPPGSRERFGDFEVPGDLSPFEGDYREEYPDYLGACERVDHNLGRIVDELKAQGIYEDTVIIYSSDHGSHFRTRNRDSRLEGFDDYKRSCHDSSLRVPLVIRGGKFSGGTVVESLVSTASLPKTILALAGVDAGSAMVGENLLDVAAGTDTSRLDEVFVQISESRVGRCIRTPAFTYAVCAPRLNGVKYMDSDEYIDDFLYDLERDPHQLTNLVDDAAYEEPKRVLREHLLKWIEKIEHKRPAIL